LEKVEAAFKEEEPAEWHLSPHTPIIPSDGALPYNLF
jgi:hypothetical protein